MDSYPHLRPHDEAVKGPDANNRFLSVKCKQCTGVLLVGYEPTSNVLLLVDARLRQRKNTYILKKKKKKNQTKYFKGTGMTQ